MQIVSRRYFAYVELTREEYLALRHLSAKEKTGMGPLVKRFSKAKIRKAVQTQQQHPPAENN